MGPGPFARWVVPRSRSRPSALVALRPELAARWAAPPVPAVGSGEHRPASAVGDAVVPPAQEGQILQVRPAAVPVVIDVMGVGPGRRGGAAGEDAAAVPGGEGPALGGGGPADGPAHV